MLLDADRELDDMEVREVSAALVEDRDVDPRVERDVDETEAVSYTHLDVYKRQV